MKKMTTDQKAFENLAIAIVWQAVEDYKEAVKAGKEKKIKELEKFFKSKWCSTLAFNNGEYILNRVKKEITEEV